MKRRLLLLTSAVALVAAFALPRPSQSFWICDGGYNDCYAGCQDDGPPTFACVKACRDWHCNWDCGEYQCGGPLYY